jgi:hypothetical protein
MNGRNGCVLFSSFTFSIVIGSDSMSRVIRLTESQPRKIPNDVLRHAASQCGISIRLLLQCAQLAR